MKHQPFEDWIFSNEPLGEEEQRKLDAHLETCDSCRTLHAADFALNGMLAGAPTLSPAPGFQARFAYRLEEQRRMRRLVRVLLVSGLILTLMAVASIFIGSVLFTRVVPFNRAVTGIGQLLVQIGFQASLSLRVLRLVASTFVRSLPQVVFFAAAIAGLGLSSLWLFSLYRFSSQPVRR